VEQEAKQRVRVLHVVRPAVGGMRAHVLQLIVGLRAFGFDSELACPGDSELIHDALEASVVVHPISIVGPLHPLRDPLAISDLVRVIRDRRPSLIHAHGSKAGLLARVAARLSGGVPTIVTVHNQVLYGGISSIVRGVYLRAERWLSRSTARVIAVSEVLRREQVEVFGLPENLVVCIYNGIDPSPFVAGGDRVAARRRLGMPEDAAAFGLAARFAPQKAHVQLVEAAIRVLERDGQAWAVLAGDGPLLETAKTKARASRVRDRILFPGFQTDMPGFLAALDVYCSAAVAEGLGIATIEAMAAGLPVVATAVGGTPEVVEEGVTGLLVPAGRPQALADALSPLLRDAVARKKMGAAGQARALELFSEARMLERTAAVYREALR